MLENKEISSPQESLAIIQEMLSKVKGTIIEKGTWMIYWGTLITFCALVTFFEKIYHFYIGFPVYNLTLLAVLVQLIYFVTCKRKKQVKNYARLVMEYVWWGFAICIFLSSFLQASSDKPIFLLVLYGLPTFITGGINKFRSMLVGAIICWICAVVAYFVPNPYFSLLVAISACFAWLVPGLILRQRYLKLKKAGTDV